MYLSPSLRLTCGCWDASSITAFSFVSLSTQTVELPLYTAPHLSLTPPHTHFPLATPPLSLCLLKIYHPYSLWGWGREQQHRTERMWRAESSLQEWALSLSLCLTLPTELPLFMFLCSKISLVCSPHFQWNTSNSSPSLLKPFLKVSKPLATFDKLNGHF